MKRIVIILFIGVFLFSWAVGSVWSQTDTLTVLHINDTHSHLVPYGPKDEHGKGTRGGIARAATLIGQVKATEENVLLLHAGDLFVDDFMFNKYFGVPELQIIAQLGCEAMVVGNHEFDLTPDVLKLALSGAGFPIAGFDILSANLDMTQDPVLAAFVKPYVIKDVGNLKVGIFGLTTEETNVFSNPAPDSVTSCIEGALVAVDSLDSQCDIIIALTHLGFAVDSILALNVPGIDLIVGGHSHTVIEEPVAVINPVGKTTWIVQAGAFYDYVGKLKIACGSDIEILSYELMTVDNSVPEEPQVAATVQYLIDDLEADPLYGPVYTEMIAEASTDIEKEYGRQYKDSPMGNLVTDAYRDTTKTDIALAAWGFISQKLYEGQLTGADIFQTVPYGYDPESGYGFKLMTFDMSGFELFLGLEYTTEQAKQTHDLYMQVSGMSLIYDSSKPFGEKIESFIIGEQPIDLGAVYSVTTNSGVFALLSMAGLDPANPQDPGIMEYEAVRDFIIINSPVSYQVEGRVEDTADTPVEEVAFMYTPRDYELFQNYPNPFNPVTTIEFALPRDTEVTLTVYNMIGQEVKVLVDSKLHAGRYVAAWDGSGMASGIYIYRLRTGDAIVSKRMVLMR